jgi:hypothetical protein
MLRFHSLPVVLHLMFVVALAELSDRNTRIAAHFPSVFLLSEIGQVHFVARIAWNCALLMFAFASCSCVRFFMFEA